MGSFAAPTESRIRFLGKRLTYWRLLARGAVPLVFTLGFHRFWVMTDVRGLLRSRSEISGETLEYIGSAWKLLHGRLVAVAVLVPLYATFFRAALQVGASAESSGMLAFLRLGFLGHPDMKARIAAIEWLAPVREGGMLLAGQEWTAVRTICKD